VEEEGDNYKALEAKLRCMALKKKPSQGILMVSNWLYAITLNGICKEI
jgi:hypothetical protein